MADLISLIVTTWNREDALDAVLRSLAAQTDRNFEIVIADDGSGEATAKLIADWAPKFPHSLKHVWQEHRGFRAAEIRNHAILASRGAYCVFLDGDCIARPGFVATHRMLAEQGWFVTGNRILMSETLTQTVLRDKLDPQHWTYGDWARERSRGGINRTVPLMRFEFQEGIGMAIRKEVLKRRGLISDSGTRAPGARIDAGTQAALERLLAWTAAQEGCAWISA